MNFNVGVIGGGPAGILAAGAAAEKGHTVTLFEKNNQLGKKLFITGKGRCNITNSAPIEEFFDNVVTNRNFLYSSLYTFDNNAIIDLLNKYGLKTKVERGNRVFPESDKSSDVIKAFKKYLDQSGVGIRLNSDVSHIKYDGESFTLFIRDGGEFKCDKLIVTTGGRSYPATGSTGDGYSFAKSLGHTVTDLRPSLVPIELNDVWVNELMGLSLRNVSLTAYSGKKQIHSEFGEMVFTHYGISGPIVLSMSNYVNGIKSNLRLTLDLKPALDQEKLDSRIVRDFAQFSNKQLKNALNELLPQRLIPWVIEASGIYPDKVVHQITKEERDKLVNALKSFPLSFKGFRPIEEGIVTSGGINVKEINPSTMESKIIPGLFFAGEIIDVDALTGGYNLQIAYSTGYLAGINV
ncbi:BaiN/RdsA family NAD(P)/FAD-dependent oxidoreductase [Gudongella sp. SC589]|uniref:NAD(P)/FAD-dependent oxidoreductase n=1 Tax=Gudongella sp. SC589 TaxID=3385990 RepID=UPI0039049B54